MSTKRFKYVCLREKRKLTQNRFNRENAQIQKKKHARKSTKHKEKRKKEKTEKPYLRKEHR